MKTCNDEPNFWGKYNLKSINVRMTKQEVLEAAQHNKSEFKQQIEAIIKSRDQYMEMYGKCSYFEMELQDQKKKNEELLQGILELIQVMGARM